MIIENNTVIYPPPVNAADRSLKVCKALNPKKIINPKISVIVPVYNVEKYLRRCIDSILVQTFKDFECILVDDCSPDNCAQICDEYERNDSRIKVIHKKQNGGLPQARKSGFEISSGKYIRVV